MHRSDVWPVAIAAAILVSAAVPLGAQSLADVARQEEARRKQIKQPARVYTNKDLVSVAAPSPPPQTSSSATPGTDDASKDAGKRAAGDPLEKGPKDPGAVKDQEYWSSRMRALTEKLDADQTSIEALRSRISTMTAAATVGPELQRAVDELDHLTQAVELGKKAVADLQEEARRAAVPPGWLR
jgi:hypothetical protein